MNVTSILTKDYENKPPSHSAKTNPIKPNFKPEQGKRGKRDVNPGRRPRLNNIEPSDDIN